MVFIPRATGIGRLVLSVFTSGEYGEDAFHSAKSTYLRDFTCKIDLNRFVINLYLLSVRCYHRTCKYEVRVGRCLSAGRLRICLESRSPLQADTVLSYSVTSDSAATCSHHEVRFREQLCRWESWVRNAIEHGTQGVSG